MSILFVTETDEGRSVLASLRHQMGEVTVVGRHGDLTVELVRQLQPDLIIVCGWRRLIPQEIIDIPPRGVVGFHSAKLPEYPGRAPVPWALVRRDLVTYDTMFYIDAGVDTGDIIDMRPVVLLGGDTPERVYRRMARASTEMLAQHLAGLLDGTAPRTPQDPARRGRLTTKDGWAAWYEMERLGAGHG